MEFQVCNYGCGVYGVQVIVSKVASIATNGTWARWTLLGTVDDWASVNGPGLERGAVRERKLVLSCFIRRTTSVYSLLSLI